MWSFAQKSRFWFFKIPLINGTEKSKVKSAILYMHILEKSWCQKWWKMMKNDENEQIEKGCKSQKLMLILDLARKESSFEGFINGIGRKGENGQRKYMGGYQ